MSMSLPLHSTCLFSTCLALLDKQTNLYTIQEMPSSSCNALLSGLESSTRLAARLLQQLSGFQTMSCTSMFLYVS